MRNSSDDVEYRCIVFKCIFKPASMVSVLDVTRPLWVQYRSGQIKDYKTDNSCFFAKHGSSTTKEWLSWNADNVSKWSCMSIWMINEKLCNSATRWLPRQTMKSFYVSTRKKRNHSGMCQSRCWGRILPERNS